MLLIRFFTVLIFCRLFTIVISFVVMVTVYVNFHTV